MKPALPASKLDHPQWLRTGAGFVTIEIVARPGSHHHGLLRVEPRGLVIGVASPAEKGKANDELFATVAEIAGVPRTAVTLLRGASTRTKVMRIVTMEPATIVDRILRSLHTMNRNASAKLG